MYNIFDMWRRVWKEYLTFPRRERNGILMLFLILLTQAVIKLWPAGSQQVYDFSVEIISGPETSGRIVTESLAEPVLSSFDPNLADDQAWKQFGLSERQIGSIRKYLSKGGRFRSKYDIDKLYGLTDIQKEKIRELVRIGTDSSAGRRPLWKKNTFEKTELNSADSAALDALKGIGPAFARRIVRYRDRLGGFMSHDQLMEVYAMDSGLLKMITAQTLLDTGIVRKIYINRSSPDELKTHPYVGYKMAQLIVSYREQHGMYEQPRDLMKIKLMKEENFIKLEPYISLDP